MSKLKSQALLAILVGATLSAFVTQSYAQVTPERRAAIIKCTKVAHMAYPDDDPDAHRGRYQAYEACMTEAKQLP